MAKLTTLAIDLSYMSFKPVLKGTKLNTNNAENEIMHSNSKQVFKNVLIVINFDNNLESRF